MPGKLETRVTELDRQIAAIGKLILAGMKMLNETQTQVKALATSQRETDGMLQGLIRSIERGGHNGHQSPPRGR
ncbi:MAG TPA: hypothetical protein VK776_17880 [Bryobacteraceae bacterium]|jgi:hypothetical protein|nr:hypothetical protein [Bryobacteraceae bacterium]